MPKQLTPKQLKFVEVLVETGSNTLAYKEAYDTGNMQDSTIYQNGWKTANKPHIKAELIKRRSEISEATLIDQAAIIEKTLKIYEDYAEGVALAKSDDKKDTAKAYRIANYVNASAALSALQDVAKMLGLQAPTTQSINNGVVINIINPDKK